MAQIDIYRKQIEDIDKEIAKLFEERMQTISKIAKYKQKNNLNIFDLDREIKLIEKNKGNITDPKLLEYYEKVFKTYLEVSKEYQNNIINK